MVDCRGRSLTRLARLSERVFTCQRGPVQVLEEDRLRSCEATIAAAQPTATTLQTSPAPRTADRRIATAYLTRGHKCRKPQSPASKHQRVERPGPPKGGTDVGGTRGL